MTEDPRGLRYVETPPGADAQSVAAAYWAFDVFELPTDPFVHRVWPHGCVTLVFACLGTTLITTRVHGAMLEPYDVPLRLGVRTRGIRFRPESGAAFLDIPPARVCDRIVDACEVLGDAVWTLGEQVAACADDAAVHRCYDAWIARRLAERRARAEDVLRTSMVRAVRQAVDLLIASNGQQRMTEVAAAVGVHPRTLQRHFVSLVGITPKQFAQVRRGRGMLRRVVEEQLTERMGWSGVAAESGYSDQAHLTREVTRFTHFSPTRLKDRLDIIEHGGLVD